MNQTTWSIQNILHHMIPLLLILSLIELYSGSVLKSLQGTLLSDPALLILVPTIISLGGNLGSILAARLSTALHLGLIPPTASAVTEQRTLKDSGTIIALSITCSILIAAGTYSIGSVTGSTLTLRTLTSITTIAGTALAVTVVGIAVTTTILAYRWGWNPDDVALPIVTNLSDIAGIIILAATILLH